jgi:heme oxygenase
MISPEPPSSQEVPLLFSAVIRTASQTQHTEAENSTFMSDLLGGRLGVDAYARYTEQLWFVYQALESPAHTAALAAHPVTAPFLRPELLRLPALERDLDHLLPAGWQHRARPLPATVAYTARIAETARDWPAGYVAHHYTRYLGDLSGGQVIRGIAEKTWGFTRKGDGVRFYVFDAIGNPAAFKRDYRGWLDALPLDDLEKQRVVDECRGAFALNTRLFADLGRAFPLSA